MITPTSIPDVVIYEPRVFFDERGYFFESFNSATFAAETGIEINFIQDNQARSVKNVLRGLHFQKTPYAQTKLVRVLHGVIWDIVVDIRKDSPSYGKWVGVELSAENKKQLFIPKGFAHGYAVLSEAAEVFYKCDTPYHKESESGIFFNDPELNIDWKINLADAILSDKDKLWQGLSDLQD